MWLMKAEAREYVLEISEPLFRLTTESVRLRSNHTRSHETLSSLLLHLASMERDVAGHDADVLRQHLKLIPAAGDIAVLLTLPSFCVDRLAGIGTSLAKLIGEQLTRGEILSLLLFDYVVERKAIQVLDALGLGAADVAGPGNEALLSH